MNVETLEQITRFMRRAEYEPRLQWELKEACDGKPKDAFARSVVEVAGRHGYAFSAAEFVFVVDALKN